MTRSNSSTRPRQIQKCEEEKICSEMRRKAESGKWNFVHYVGSSMMRYFINKGTRMGPGMLSERGENTRGERADAG